MSVRQIVTQVIDCDGCDRVYADAVVFLPLATLEAAAEREGWEFRGTEAFCPRCKAMRECQEQRVHAAERKWGQAAFGGGCP